MIRSMTGYGRAEGGDESGGFAVEMRAVNNRFLEVQVKLHRSISPLEPRVRRAVQSRFARGRIDVFINRHDGGSDSSFRYSLNHRLAGQYLDLLRDMKKRFDLQGDADLGLLSSLPDVIVREEVAEDMEQVWQRLDPLVQKAMDGLEEMRTAEGDALERDIADRLTSIEATAEEVSVRAPETVELARARMRDSLQRLLQEQPDPSRLAQEIAILAERTDITEELTRLGIHLGQFRSMLAASSAEPVGRKLDFLLQEMGREINTVASKASDANISLLVVNIKADIEKIREQVQNIE
jgi:uncharacterized protein (TIGR00255 family)